MNKTMTATTTTILHTGMLTVSSRATYMLNYTFLVVARAYFKHVSTQDGCRHYSLFVYTFIIYCLYL